MDLAEGPRLTFEVSGAHAGPPVLLLRPLHAKIEGLKAFHAALAARLRVIDLDGALPANEADPSLWSSRAMGRSALAVLGQLGVPRAHVLGLARGALSAAWLAIDAPLHVARVCFLAAPPTTRALLRVHHARAPTLFLSGAREELPAEALSRALAHAASAIDPCAAPGAIPLDRALLDPRAAADRALRFFLDAEAVTLRARGR